MCDELVDICLRFADEILPDTTHLSDIGFPCMQTPIRLSDWAT